VLLSEGIRGDGKHDDTIGNRLGVGDGARFHVEVGHVKAAPGSMIVRTVQVQVGGRTSLNAVESGVVVTDLARVEIAAETAFRGMVFEPEIGVLLESRIDAAQPVFVVAAIEALPGGPGSRRAALGLR